MSTNEHDIKIAVDEVPEAVVVPRRRWEISLVWLIPALALVIGGWLAVHAWLQRGPIITIHFKTAEGIEAGKTMLKYKNIEVGQVQELTLSKDRSQVIVTARMNRQAEDFLVEDTRFWVVRPRISAGGVSGIGTLLGGTYIGMDAGKSELARSDFVGLEHPSIVTSDRPGRLFALRGEDVGSLDIGSPVYFRRIEVGEVAGFALDADGKGVRIEVFVNAPYDRYVNSNTRFWHASGIDARLDASGVRLNTESLVSLLLGGLAFQTMDGSGDLAPAAPGTVFPLFADRTAAERPTDTTVETGVMVFRESVRGLVPGAPIDFRGVVIGEVVSINIDFDRTQGEIIVPVSVRLYPDRLRSHLRNSGTPFDSRQLIGQLVNRGLRAQLRTGNLLTGQLYIALDFFPKSPKVQFDPRRTPIELPTIAGSLQELQATLGSIAAKLDRFPIEALGTRLESIANKLDQLPFDAIAGDLRQAVASAQRLMTQLDTGVVPEAKAVLGDSRRALAALEKLVAPDAPLQRDARDTMRELTRAAQSLRILADYLERHPESLIRGKPEDAK